MSTSSMLKAKGLHTFLNFLSAVPEGALFEAENVIIDRDGVIEPRRGIKILGDIPNTAKQLLTYRNTILVHNGDALAFSNGNDPATFTSFKGRSDVNPSDVDTTADTITILSHGLNEDDMIVFTSTGTLPAPLNSGTTYYVANPTQNTIQLSSTLNGLPINLTTQGTGIHTATYDYVIVSPDSIARIKSVEINGNLFVTSANGIKKITGLNQYFIGNSGVVRALDLALSVNLSSVDGFLDPNKEVSYRVTWAYTDINSNFLEGTPSYRATVINPDSAVSKNVNVSFPIPSNITTDYSFRIYRTAQANAGGSGDECRLVYESQITEAQITAGVVDIIDEQPEELQASGTNLYTNQFSGEGISQSNDQAPIAKDVAAYKNIMFFANTTTNHKYNVNLLGRDGLVHLAPGSIASVSFSAGETTFTITGGHGLTANQDVVIIGTTTGNDATYAAIRISATQFKVPGDLSLINIAKTSIFTSYITITKGSTVNKYYFVGRPEKTSVTVALNNVAAEGLGFTISTANNEIDYYVWLNFNGATTVTIPAGYIGLEVAYVTGDTTAQIATKVAAAMEATGNFIADAVSTTINITCANSGPATDIANLSAAFTGASVTQQGFGQDVANHYVRFSSYVSAALGLEDTAKSLVYVISQNNNDVVNAYYTSQLDELPGSLLLEAKNTDNIAFDLIASSNALPTDVLSTTGSMFNPNIATTVSSTNESFPNRIYFSKTSQPEAVPSTNNIDVGPKDKKILRILGLRDSLFILKEEGVYRLTGETTTSFTVALFDNSTNLIAADTAAILNNQIYALTSQGVATISETGVGIISRPVENIFSRVTSPDYVNYASASFAFGYEADRAYLIFTVDKTTDTYATKAYRYNTFTQSWTSWKKSATCGVVETSGNKLYLGAADVAGVEIERKRLTSRDYADREYTRQLTAYSFGFIIDSATNMEEGDVIEQVQYLSAYDVNKLIKKAKLDPILQMSSSYPEITATGLNLRVLMENLATQLDISDTTLITTTFNGATDVTINPTNTITISGHAFLNGDTIKLTGGTMPTGLTADVFYYVVNKTTNTIQLSLTEGGSAIVISAVGSGTITIKEHYLYSSSEDFATLQDVFNYNVGKLNGSSGVFFTNYQESVGTLGLNSIVAEVTKNINKIVTHTTPTLFQGPFTHYKAIKSSVIWAPISLGEPSVFKHIRSGTFLLESNVIAGATVGYASDLSGNFEDMTIGIDQDGNWGEGDWNNFTWGGEGTSVPIRVLIPRQKQRCRYIRARYKHSNALEKYSILGISYTFEMGSDRAYR